MTIKVNDPAPHERTHKLCPRCQTVKPSAAFSPRLSAADGMSAHCRGCRAEHARKARATPAGRERYNKAAREYARRLKARATATSPESSGN